jgi:hypothetical protein
MTSPREVRTIPGIANPRTDPDSKPPAGRDGALRRPRRRAKRQATARATASVRLGRIPTLPPERARPRAQYCTNGCWRFDWPAGFPTVKRSSQSGTALRPALDYPAVRMPLEHCGPGTRFKALSRSETGAPAALRGGAHPGKTGSTQVDVASKLLILNGTIDCDRPNYHEWS